MNSDNVYAQISSGNAESSSSNWLSWGWNGLTRLSSAAASAVGNAITSVAYAAWDRTPKYDIAEHRIKVLSLDDIPERRPEQGDIIGQRLVEFIPEAGIDTAISQILPLGWRGGWINNTIVSLAQRAFESPNARNIAAICAGIYDVGGDTNHFSNVFKIDKFVKAKPEIATLYSKVWQSSADAPPPLEPVPAIATEQLKANIANNLDKLVHLSSNAVAWIACSCFIDYLDNKDLDANFVQNSLNSFIDIKDNRGETSLEDACLVALKASVSAKNWNCSSLYKELIASVYDIVAHQSQKLVANVTDALHAFVQDLDNPAKRARVIESLQGVAEDLSKVVIGYKSTICDSDRADDIESKFADKVDELLAQLPDEDRQDALLHSKIDKVVGKLRLWALDPKYYFFGSWPTWRKPKTFGEGVKQVAIQLGGLFLFIIKIFVWLPAMLVEWLCLFIARRKIAQALKSVKISECINWITEQLKVDHADGAQQGIPDLLITPLNTAYKQLAQIFSDATREATQLQENHKPEQLAIITQKAMQKQAHGAELYKHLELIINDLVRLGKVQSAQDRHASLEELQRELDDLRSTPALKNQYPDADWTKFTETFNQLSTEEIGSLDNLTVSALLEQVFRALNFLAAKAHTDAGTVLTPINSMLEASIETIFSKPEELTPELRERRLEDLDASSKSMWAHLSNLINTVAMLSDEPSMFAELEEYADLLTQGAALAGAAELDKEAVEAWINRHDELMAGDLFEDCLSSMQSMVPQETRNRLLRSYTDVLTNMRLLKHPGNHARHDARLVRNVAENVEAFRAAVNNVRPLVHKYRFEEASIAPKYKHIEQKFDESLSQRALFTKAFGEQIEWLRTCNQIKPPQHLEAVADLDTVEAFIDSDLVPLRRLLYEDDGLALPVEVDALILMQLMEGCIDKNEAFALKLLLYYEGLSALSDVNFVENFTELFNGALSERQQDFLQHIIQQSADSQMSIVDTVKNMVRPQRFQPIEQEIAAQAVTAMNELLNASLARSIVYACANRGRVDMTFHRHLCNKAQLKMPALEACLDNIQLEPAEVTIQRIVTRTIDGAVTLQANALVNQSLKTLKNTSLVSSVMKIFSASAAKHVFCVEA